MTIPTVNLVYDLADISGGTASWFASTWPMLAFSIAIPLAFYVAGRVKGLFA